MTVATQPAVADKTEAEQLTRRAYEAEILGDTKEARSLLRRASELDETNESTAYHLGRASEALGDRASALTAYCRFLALTPTTAEAVEARQRVATLSQSELRVAARRVSERARTRRRAPAATAGHVARRQRMVGPRVVASATAEPSVSPTSSATSPERDTRSAIAGASGADDPPSPSDPATDSPDVAATADSTEARSDVVAPPRRVPPVDEPSTPSRPERRGPSRAQRASIGAVTGAIIGAATTRSVKGAVIGAAAGGMLGTVVGGELRPVGRGIVP